MAIENSRKRVRRRDGAVPLLTKATMPYYNYDPYLKTQLLPSKFLNSFYFEIRINAIMVCVRIYILNL